MAHRPDPLTEKSAADTIPRRLFVASGGFLTDRRIHRILTLAGHRPRIGWPGPDDMVAAWGQRPTAARAEALSRRTGAPVLRVEDAFLRSLRPGRAGDPPLGLLLDANGIHFDASRPSDLETLLARHPLDDTALLSRARRAIERIKAAHLTKYAAVDPALPVPDPGYVLVIDQTRGDASLPPDPSIFREMLVFAQSEHPGARVVIKTHPETVRGDRPGHFDDRHASDRITLLADPVSPWHLFEGAVGVYTVSSQLGFEAILAGHKPRVFGQPFYAGWGLTQDENPVARRERKLTRAQLFAAAMILYPVWYDPYRDRLTELETVIDTLEAEARAWRENRAGAIAHGMRLWKRGHIRRFLSPGPVRFEDDPAKAEALSKETGQRLLTWGMKAPDLAATRVEDGFLRSRGLGAELVPPLSLVTDDLGIYYDPSRESRLDRLIATALTEAEEDRARRLVAALTRGRISKYNLGGAMPDLPEGHRILVAGQVEDDASVRLGCGELRTNRALLEAARAANPGAVLVYKPHPDVEAGLRPGAVPDAADLADLVATRADPVALVEAVQEVWSLTSLIGFEALLRGKRVTCVGTPFYAGWGLTTDLGPPAPHRTAKPSLLQLAHAALIAYPRYLDPVTGRPCPVEVAVDRLAHGPIPHPGLPNRLLSKLQGLFASTPFWR